MNILGLHFHKWVYIPTRYTYKYRGGECQGEYTAHRMCKDTNCTEVQELDKHWIDGGWETLNHCEKMLVLSDLKTYDGVFLEAIKKTDSNIMYTVYHRRQAREAAAVYVAVFSTRELAEASLKFAQDKNKYEIQSHIVDDHFVLA